MSMSKAQRQEDLAKLKQVMKLEFDLINQGQEEGEFTCPFCGGKASFRLVRSPIPDGPNNKRIISGCENGCFH